LTQYNEYRVVSTSRNVDGSMNLWPFYGVSHGSIALSLNIFMGCHMVVLLYLWTCFMGCHMVVLLYLWPFLWGVTW